MLVAAQELKFADTIIFEGETYHVIEAAENSAGTINVYMSPTDGLGLDRIFAFPKPFSFETISRLQV
jgi:hypothetical protein